MRFDLPYGDGTYPIEIDEGNILDVLQLHDVPVIEHPEKALLENLENPIGTEPLGTLLQRKSIKRLVIILTDHTRGCPYPVILPPLIDFIIETGVSPEAIEFLIANGTHSAMSVEQMRRQYGTSVVESFPFHCNDCRADDMVYMGDLNARNPFFMNPIAASADFLITTGVINTHYMAGFSGGRKSILPGVSSYETIRSNHSMVLDRRVDLARLDDNPIHLQMSEAAVLANVDFNINLILDDHKQIAKIFSGDIHDAFHAGARHMREHFSVPCRGLADAIVVTPGGQPKDRTLFHTQKCLNNVFPMLREGGTVIVFSPCNEGAGSDEMVRFLRMVDHPSKLLRIPPERITVGGHRAVATAKLMEKGEIILFSKMAREDAEAMHFTVGDNWQAVLEGLKAKHGDDVKIRIIPNGNQFYGVLSEA